MQCEAGKSQHLDHHCQLATCNQASSKLPKDLAHSQKSSMGFDLFQHHAMDPLKGLRMPFDAQ